MSHSFPAQASTWGPEARAVFVGHGHLPKEWPNFEAWTCDGYPKNLLVPATITDAMGTARLEWVLRRVSAAGVDFAFMANDHTAILAPNLACFLKRLDPAAALYAGHALAQRNGKQPPEVFNSGASGYVLTRATLDLLEAAWAAEDPACSAAAASKWLQGNPQGRKRERNSQLQRLLSRPYSTRFG